MVELRIISVNFGLLFEVEVPKYDQGQNLSTRCSEESTHVIIPSTSKSSLHCSALNSISLAFATSNLRARKNLPGGKCQSRERSKLKSSQPEEGSITHPRFNESIFLFQLLPEGFKGVLLRDSEIAESSRRGLVVGIRDTRRHGTCTGSLLGISHSNDDEKGGG